LALALCYSSCSYSADDRSTQELLCAGCEVTGTLSGDVENRGGVNVYGYEGGEEVYRTELAQHLTEAQLQAGFALEGQVAAMACLNTIGSNMSCEDVGDPTADTMRITLEVADGQISYQQQTTYSVSNPPSEGFQTYRIGLPVPENELTLSRAYAEMTIFGIDEGFWQGNFGIATRSPGILMDYQTNPIVTTGQDQATQQVLASVENQISAPTMPSFMNDAPQTPDTGSAESAAPDSDTSSGDSEAGTEPSINDIEIEGSEQDEINVPPNLAGGGASAAREATRMAAMAQAAADVSSYRAATYPDRQFYAPVELKGGETWDNPASRRWRTGADQRMEAMIDMQWSD
jgi:hypothetical protein